MALTEEQKTAMNLAAAEMCITGEPWMEEFAARFLAYLPKPDPDAWIIRFKSGSLPDGLLDVHYHATNAIADYRQIDPEATCEPLYTEAPIAQPASAPSEQKPVEDFIKWGGGACPVGENDLVDVIFVDGEAYKSTRAGGWGWNSDQAKSIVAYRPLGNAALQPDYKAQRDALLELLESAIEFGYIPKLPEPCLLTKALTVIAGVKGDKCKTCNGEGGWEAAASSTSYFWKDCPDCTALASVKGGA